MDFKFKSPSELKERPDGSGAWVVERLLPKDSCCLVAGAPKTRKSWFVYEMLVSVATSTPAFGAFETNGGKVMLIQGEDSEGIIRERLNLIAKARGAHVDTLKGVEILAGKPFHLDNDEHFNWLERQVQTNKPSLVILDPFIRLIPNTNENSSGPVSRVLGKLRALQRATGATIIVVHHYGKDGSPRGSSDFHGWLDAGFYMTKPSETSPMTQVRLEFKGFKEAPDLFFKLEKIQSGTAPVGVLYKPDAE